MQSVGKAYYSPPALILDIANVFCCGWTNPDTYAANKYDAAAAATSIRLRREAFVISVPKQLARARPNQRIEEVAAIPGAAPTGITGVAVDFTSDAGAGAADTGAVVQFQREHQALVVRRATAEAVEREASARAHDATARAQSATAVYTEFQIAQAQKHAPLIDAKLTDEAETAALGKAAAAAVVKKSDADVRKADAEARLVEQEVERKRKLNDLEVERIALELRQQEADAEEARRLKREAAAREADEERAIKRKQEEEETAAKVVQRRKRIAELEVIVRTAPALIDVTEARSELVDLIMQANPVLTISGARGNVTKMWKMSHPSSSPPKKRARRAPPAQPMQAPAPPVGPAPPAPLVAEPLLEIPACGVDVFDTRYVFDNIADQGVYVVAESLLPDSRVYVGYSQDPTRRTQNHANEMGGTDAAAGFRYRRPLITTTQAETGKDRELAETLLRMHTAGYDKVRGATWTARLESVREAFKLNCHKYDICFRCAQGGHYCTNIQRTWRCPFPYFDLDAVANRYWN